MKLTKEVKIGILTVVSGAILYFGFRYLRGIDMFRSVNTYYVIFEKLDQVKVSTNVVINGLKVGRVSKTILLQDRGDRVLVEFEVNSDIQLTRNTIARQASLDLVNPKVLSLEISPGEKAVSGDTLVGDIEKTLMQTVEEKVKPVLQQIDTIAEFLKTFGILRDKLVDVAVTFDQRGRDLAPVMTKTTLLIDSTTRLIATVHKVSQNLPSLLNQYRALADTLSRLKLTQTVDESRRLLAELRATLGEINSGKGTIGKLVADDSLYINLNRTLSDLDKVLVLFNENPNHFLAPLGKKPKKNRK